MLIIYNSNLILDFIIIAFKMDFTLSLFYLLFDYGESKYSLIKVANAQPQYYST